jgi:hydroxylamine reductase (hybrid-cluster protein)
MSNFKTLMICNQNGSVQSIIDEREVESVREYRLRQIRKRAARLIEEAVPEFKQRNIAMGIITGSEKTALLSQINAVRDYCNGLEDQINSVEWDGEDDTRASACDEIESVGWNYEG